MSPESFRRNFDLVDQGLDDPATSSNLALCSLFSMSLTLISMVFGSHRFAIIYSLFSIVHFIFLSWIEFSAQLLTLAATLAYP
ncbi:MAG: hypothetical protein A2X94_16320 [Bdellovibrionales bacterium GWB1_55_8]|nr:MAG: hypothetical protein A2X94_16320 [Bdellovibrionales bacterium GWB1_55_8]